MAMFGCASQMVMLFGGLCFAGLIWSPLEEPLWSSLTECHLVCEHCWFTPAASVCHDVFLEAGEIRSVACWTQPAWLWWVHERWECHSNELTWAAELQPHLANFHRYYVGGMWSAVLLCAFLPGSDFKDIVSSMIACVVSVSERLAIAGEEWSAPPNGSLCQRFWPTSWRYSTQFSEDTDRFTSLFKQDALEFYWAVLSFVAVAKSMPSQPLGVDMRSWTGLGRSFLENFFKTSLSVRPQ